MTSYQARLPAALLQHAVQRLGTREVRRHLRREESVVEVIVAVDFMLTQWLNLYVFGFIQWGFWIFLICRFVDPPSR